MWFRPPLRVEIPRLAALACAALLSGCMTVPEKESAYFRLEADPALVTYQRITIQLKDSLGNMQATLYDDTLPDLSLLEHLSAGPYSGGRVYITILGYKRDQLAYRETRLYDGEIQQVISLDIIKEDPVPDPVVPAGPGPGGQGPGGPGPVVPVPAGPDTVIKPVKHAPVLSAFPGDTVVSIRDRVPLPAEASDADGDLAAYTWDCDGDGHPEDSAALVGYKAKIAFARTYADSGTRVCTLKVWDKDGLSAQGKVKIRVSWDPPTANAGKDTTVTVESTIFLHARGYDSLGPIIYMEWKIGSAEFKPIPQGETSIKAPSVPGDLVCILRVNDSDSLTALDTMVVKVVYNPDNTLSDLRSNVGVLQPAFRKEVHAYTLSLAYKDSLLVLSPTVSETYAQAKILAGNAPANPANALPMAVGDNLITILVTAQDGSTLQYSVTARREGAR